MYRTEDGYNFGEYIKSLKHKMFLLLVDSKNIQTKIKYPFRCPIYSINIKLGMILNYCIAILNIKWKCSNIM